MQGVTGLRSGTPSEAHDVDGKWAGRPRSDWRSSEAVDSVDYGNDKFTDVGPSASRQMEI